jgi:hypothetical protein
MSMMKASAGDSFLSQIENEINRGPPPPKDRQSLFNSIAIDHNKLK